MISKKMFQCIIGSATSSESRRMLCCKCPIHKKGCVDKRVVIVWVRKLLLKKDSDETKRKAV